MILSRIRELREAKGWGQRELAERSGVSQSAISDIENGKRDPSIKTVKKVAIALGVTILDLDEEVQTTK